MSNNTNNTLVAQINVVADEDPNTRGVIIIRPTSGVLIDAEIEPSTVDEIEALVGDSFKGTVVHMTCGFLYASIPCEDGSLMIDESRAMIVDEAEMRKHSCVEVVQQIVAKACSDRVNGKLQKLTSLPSAEIQVEIGERLRLQAQLGDKRVELSAFSAAKHNAIMRLIAAIARVLCSIAMIFAGATSDDMLLFIIGVGIGAICIAWLPEAVHSTIAHVRTCGHTRRLMNQMTIRLDELKPASKKG